MMKKDKLQKIMITKIEEQTEGRIRNFWVFGLSLNEEEELKFNEGLKKLVNEINQT